jgi:hypothetical protein
VALPASAAGCLAPGPFLEWACRNGHAHDIAILEPRRGSNLVRHIDHGVLVDQSIGDPLHGVPLFARRIQVRIRRTGMRLQTSLYSRSLVQAGTIRLTRASH